MLAYRVRTSAQKTLGRHLTVCLYSIGTVALVFVAMYGKAPLDESEQSGARRGLNEARFERSSSRRLEIWTTALEGAWRDDPLGVGPKGLTAQGLLTEADGTPGSGVHSDAIGWLVERGVIGFAGIALLLYRVFRWGPPGGVVRTVIVGALVAGLFRSTLNFRHLWIVLALSVVADSAIAIAGRQGDRERSAFASPGVM